MINHITAPCPSLFGTFSDILFLCSLKRGRLLHQLLLLFLLEGVVLLHQLLLLLLLEWMVAVVRLEEQEGLAVGEPVVDVL
jgi:hypothetical protein